MGTIRTMTVAEAITKGAICQVEAPSEAGFFLGIPQVELAQVQVEADAQGLGLHEWLARRYVEQLSVEIASHMARE